MASDEANRDASPQPPAQRPNQPPPPAPTPSPTSSPTPPAYDNPAFTSDEPEQPARNGSAVEDKTGSPAKLNGNHRRDLSGLDHTPQQKKDPAEAVNLELVNMSAPRHQNGSSNETANTRLPHKKDTQNQTSNYDEYFVPVNEHKKYMRGEKLYVTAEKGRLAASPGGRRKACWIAGLLALAAAVVIAVLAGTGVIFSNGTTPLRNDTFAASAARSFGSQASPTHPNHIEGSGDEAMVYVPKAVEGVFVIDNAEFFDDLSKSDSRAFKSLAQALEEAITDALFDSQTRNYGTNDLTVKIVNFTSGSIVVTYRVSWTPKNGLQNTNDPITMETLNLKFKSYLKKKSNRLSKYRIRIDSIKSEKIIDVCKFDKNGCENGCEFNRNQLRFVCICRDNKVPDPSNPKKCVNPQLDLDTSEIPDYVDVSKVVPVSSAHPQPEPEGDPETKELDEFGWTSPKFLSTESKIKPTTESVWAEPKFLSTEPSSEPEPKSEPTVEPVWAEPKFLSTEAASSEPEPKAETIDESAWAEPKFLSTEPSSKPEPKAEPTKDSDWAEPKFLSTEAASSEPEPKAEPATESAWAEPKFLSTEPSSQPEPKAEPTNDSDWAEPKFLSTEPSSKPEPKAATTTELDWAEPKFLSTEASSISEPKAEPTTDSEWAEPKFLSTEAASSEPEPKANPTTEPVWAEPKFLSTEPSSEPEPKSEPTAEPVWAKPKFLSTESTSSEPEPKAEPTTEPVWADPKFLFTEAASSEPEPKAEPATESTWVKPKFLSTEPSSEPEPKAEPATESAWAEPKFLSTEQSSQPEPKAEPTNDSDWSEPKFLSTEPSSVPEPKAEPATESAWAEPKFLSTEQSSQPEPKAEPTNDSDWAEPKFLSTEPSSVPEPKVEPATESVWAEAKFLSTEPDTDLTTESTPTWKEPDFVNQKNKQETTTKNNELSQNSSYFEGRSISVIALEPEVESNNQSHIEHSEETSSSKDAVWSDPVFISTEKTVDSTSRLPDPKFTQVLKTTEATSVSGSDIQYSRENVNSSSDDNEWLNPEFIYRTANESKDFDSKMLSVIEPSSSDDEWLDSSFTSDSTNALWTEPKMFISSSEDSSNITKFTTKQSDLNISTSETTASSMWSEPSFMETSNATANSMKSDPNSFTSSFDDSTSISSILVEKPNWSEPKFITSSKSSSNDLAGLENSSESESKWSEPEFMSTVSTRTEDSVMSQPKTSTFTNEEAMLSNPSFVESSGENTSVNETLWSEPNYISSPIEDSSNSSSSNDMWIEPQLANTSSEELTNFSNTQSKAKTDSNVIMILGGKAKNSHHNSANFAVSVGNETSISVSSNNDAGRNAIASENYLEDSERNISAARAIPKYIYDLQNTSEHEDESATLMDRMHSPAPVWEEREIEPEHVYTSKDLDDEDLATVPSTLIGSKAASNEISQTSESNYLLFGSTHAHDDANTTAGDDGWIEPQVLSSTNKGLKPHIYEVTTQPNEDRPSVSYHFVHSNATTEMSPFLPDLEGHGEIFHERHELETSTEHEYMKSEEPLNVEPLLAASGSPKNNYEHDPIASSTESVSETTTLNDTNNLMMKMAENKYLSGSNKSTNKESLWEEPSYTNSLSDDDDWLSVNTTSAHDEESLSVVPLSKPSKKYEYSKKYDKLKQAHNSELNDIDNGKKRNLR